MNNLSNQIKMEVLQEYEGSTGDLTTSAVNVANYDGVLFLVNNIDDADLDKIEIEQKDADDNWQKLDGAMVEADADNQLLWVDVYRPLEEIGTDELRVVITTESGEENAVGPVFALLYHGRHIPEENNNPEADEDAKGVLVVSPDKA